MSKRYDMTDALRVYNKEFKKPYDPLRRLDITWNCIKWGIPAAIILLASVMGAVTFGGWGGAASGAFIATVLMVFFYCFFLYSTSPHHQQCVKGSPTYVPGKLSDGEIVATVAFFPVSLPFVVWKKVKAHNETQRELQQQILEELRKQNRK